VRTTLVERMHGSDQAMAQMTMGGMSPSQALSSLDQLIQGQAVMLSTNYVFMVVGLLMLLSASVIWLAPKPKGPPVAAPAGH
jgi:DHA2 family multidrug resistance protein